MSNTRLTQNGDVKLAYEDLGGAGGEPLLLVMGLAVSRFWWPPGFIEALIQRGFHVVAYDQRDAGESDRMPETNGGHPFTALLRRREGAYASEDMTDDAVCVMTAMGWESAHMFGHSMGGLLAQRAALRHPDRTRSITSSGALPSDASGLKRLSYIRMGTLVKLSRMKFEPGRDGDIQAGLAMARLIASPAYPFDEAAAREWIERDAISGVRDTKAQHRQMSAEWHGPRLAQVTVPTLVLHGESDQILRPKAGRDTAAAIPGARLVTFPGVGHDLPNQLAGRYATEMRRTADLVTR